MKRLRAQLAHFGPLVAGLVALSIAAPRAALLYHHHDGGERAHVHADDDAIDEIIEHWHAHATAQRHTLGASLRDHTAAHHREAPSTARCALTRDDGATPGHWHEQQRFHRALAASMPMVAASGFVVAAAPHSPTCSSRVAALSRHPRAPPSPRSLS